MTVFAFFFSFESAGAFSSRILNELDELENCQFKQSKTNSGRH